MDRIRRVVPNYKRIRKANFTAVKTRNRIVNIKELWASCQSLHINIQLAAQEAESKGDYFDNDEFLLIEADYEEALDFLTELLANQDSNHTANTSRSRDSSLLGLHQNPAAFALPRITIPTFKGDPTKWESFRDSFQALVDNNDALTPGQKLYFLKSFLEGEAALLIQNIAVSDSNYSGAWQLLVDEYDNLRSLVFAHIDAFATLPVMKTETALELKHLRDTVNASLAALRNLNRPVEHWDDLLIYLIVRKFCVRTCTEWNLRLGSSNECPSFKLLQSFLTERIRGITDLNRGDDITTASRAIPSSVRERAKVTVHNVTARHCPCCKASHFLTYCPVFKRKPLETRFQIAKQARVCFNCLREGHFPAQCPTEKTCVKCHRSHHSLLHREFHDNAESAGNPQPSTSSLPSTDRSNDFASHSAALHTRPLETVPVLLATAWVNLRTAEGRLVPARALLDQGACFSFITESLAQRLRTSRHRADLHVTVFGEVYQGTATTKVHLSLESRFREEPSVPMVAYVYQKITTYAAKRSRNFGSWAYLKDLELADPNPSGREPIDVLIGADLYGTLLLGPLRKGPFGSPTAQLTSLGWIISGPTGDSELASRPSRASLHCVSASNIDHLITRFWELEEVPRERILTPDEEKCEHHFLTTHTRDASGRYIVRLPFRESPPPRIGGNFHSAVARFERAERRLAANSELALEYNKFLTEYLSLGHMEFLRSPELLSCALFIPHHPVIRKSSSTTKLRVVFNASSLNSDGTSLNDHLLIGPKLQSDISSVILRWRQHRYVFMADIEKMFRQIVVHSDDTRYQCIVWRPHPGDPIEGYQLRTVTYGTACAPYLAIRVLLQLATDEGAHYPEAAEIVRSERYVDDILFGHDNITMARESRDQLIGLLLKGGFHLRKWASNEPSLLSDLPDDVLATPGDHLFEETSVLIVLGLTWFLDDDTFRFRVATPVLTTVTKRTILSFIARLFDPLGWASPVILSAKLIMQDLWLQKLDWNEPVPESLLRSWNDFRSHFSSLDKVRIPRWTHLLTTDSVVELHGFSDASQRAYSAVVYLRILHSPQRVSVALIAAKSKVAPLKTVAILRLELKRALLLVRLLDYVKRTLRYNAIPIYGWTDSAVVLAWIAQHPSRWNSYVANRVSEIQTTLPNLKWRHVPSQFNPADCASRGINVMEFLRHPLWWSGPTWLSKPSVFWPNPQDTKVPQDSSLPEIVDRERRTTTVTHISSPTETWDLAFRYSNWGKLLRITALLFRFIRIVRERLRPIKCSTNPSVVAHLDQAREFWLKTLQESHFRKELHALRNNETIPRPSPLTSLNPFLDRVGLLRLGSRLRHSFLSYNERFPILLPRHHLSDVIADHAHLRSMHGGAQRTLRILRQNYWILGARSLVKARIKRCLTCVRERAVTATQLMGDLPSPRVNPSPPFSNCGIDYAGPFLILPRVGRGQRALKHYVAIFVCLATRAVHLESVEDYTTAGFIAAFRRFTSRRGLPSQVYSDNGTNFQGAERELRHAFLAICKDPALRDAVANDGVTWHFIPAAAPHFGGLWEAGVKSFKYHFKRVVGGRTLSQPEFTTLLCEIEACLNSRPLTALNDDPETFDALTPGHFLIGRPLLSVPEPSQINVPDNRLTRWQRVQAFRDHIWRAWSHDYLHFLHQRAKWRTVSPVIKANDLVLLKHPSLPPGKWDLARVVAVHPGSDGLVRVVTVKTAKTTLKRPITQICPLIPAS